MSSSQKLVVHVADIELSEESGMGRIAYQWKNEFLRRGYEFVHIGPTQVGQIPHRGLFPYAAYRAYQRLGKPATFFLVHEAAAGPFMRRKVPAAVFSHGLDRRSWENNLAAGIKFPWTSRITFPLWRLRHCDEGIKKGNILLYSNHEDIDFTESYYHRNGKDIYVFKNGIYPVNFDEQTQPSELTIAFLASWIERKGFRLMIRAAEILAEKGMNLKWLVAGTGKDVETVLSFWPSHLHSSVEVIPRFPRADEPDLLARSSIFILPSSFEGQPLSLLQAMAGGRCCITTNCCGQRDLIQHEYNGLLHSPGDGEQLAALIERCVKDESFRLMLATNARKSVEGRTWEAVSAELVDHIEASLKIPA